MESARRLFFLFFKIPLPVGFYSLGNSSKRLAPHRRGEVETLGFDGILFHREAIILVLVRFARFPTAPGNTRFAMLFFDQKFSPWRCFFSYLFAILVGKSTLILHSIFIVTRGIPNWPTETKLDREAGTFGKLHHLRQPRRPRLLLRNWDCYPEMLCYWGASQQKAETQDARRKEREIIAAGGKAMTKGRGTRDGTCRRCRSWLGVDHGRGFFFSCLWGPS